MATPFENNLTPDEESYLRAEIARLKRSVGICSLEDELPYIV